ncbi:unnamed protein product [Camellia sinensis]
MLQGLLIIDTRSDSRYQGRTFSSSVVLGIYGGRLWTSGKIANTSMAKDCWRWWMRRPTIDWFNMIVKSLIHYELEKKTKDYWREPTRRLTLGINLCIECKSESPILHVERSYHVDEPSVVLQQLQLESIGEPASQGSALLADEEASFCFVGKKKKKKKPRLPLNAAGMQWKRSQDLAAENYMMPRPCCL